MPGEPNGVGEHAPGQVSWRRCCGGEYFAGEGAQRNQLPFPCRVRGDPRDRGHQRRVRRTEQEVPAGVEAHRMRLCRIASTRPPACPAAPTGRRSLRRCAADTASGGASVGRKDWHDPQIVTDRWHQQCEPFRTVQNLGRQPAVACELHGQLVIVEQLQILQRAGRCGARQDATMTASGARSPREIRC